MKRREFIMLVGGTAAAWPLAVHAQQREPMRRIGVLVASAADESDMQERLAGFRQGTEKLGWSEGRNVHIDIRFAAGRADQYQSLAKASGRLPTRRDPGPFASDCGGVATRERYDPDRVCIPSPIRSVPG